MFPARGLSSHMEGRVMFVQRVLFSQGSLSCCCSRGAVFSLAPLQTGPGVIGNGRTSCFSTEANQFLRAYPLLFFFLLYKTSGRKTEYSPQLLGLAEVRARYAIVDRKQ